MKREIRIGLVVLVTIGLLSLGGAWLGQSRVVSPSPEKVYIVAWASGSPVDATRALNLVSAEGKLNEELKAEESPYKVYVDATFTHVWDWEAYRRKFILACEAKEAPHIWTGGHEEVAWMAAADYIISLDDYIAKYREKYELDDIYEALWEAGKWKGLVWCFPQDTEARPVYFRKDILRAIGWSEEEIEALPQKVLAGEFTLDDMIAVAKEALEKKPKSVDGFDLEWGVFHRPSPGGYFHMITMAYGGQLQDPETGKLVLDKDAMLKNLEFHAKLVTEGITPPDMTLWSWRTIHKYVVEGRVLFWFGGTWHWAEWQRVAYHEILGGLPEEYEWENIGFMLVPAPVKGGKPITQSHPFCYMLMSDKCVKEPYPELAFRLVAHTAQLELTEKHAMESGHLTIRKTISPEYEAWAFGAAATPMLEYTTTLPNHELWPIYHRVVYDAIVAVETGEMTPTDALAWLEDELVRELGDEVIVR